MRENHARETRHAGACCVSQKISIAVGANVGMSAHMYATLWLDRAGQGLEPSAEVQGWSRVKSRRHLPNVRL